MMSVVDYKRALAEREKYQLDSKEWQTAQKNLEAVIAILLAGGSGYMADEIRNDLASLNDCGAELDDPVVAHSLWMLETFGFGDMAEKIREWDWR